MAFINELISFGGFDEPFKPQNNTSMKKYLWKVVMEKSSIQIKARYMRIGLIVADFKKFQGEILTERGFKNPEINFVIEAGSVSTQNKGLTDRSALALFYLLKAILKSCFPVLKVALPVPVES